jgi:protein-S-isoprenylcysteine O-methyltransferase Ste14
MQFVLDIIIIVLLFSIFAISHSILAAFDVKQKITEKIGSMVAFYRLFYNATSILFFTTIYYVSPKPSLLIYDLQFPFDLIIFGVQILGVVGFFWSASYIDLSEFLGISQIRRYLNNSYSLTDLDEHHVLILSGPFKYSRHPIYFFSIIILGFRSTMDLFYLIFFICMALYFFIGSVFEEKSLVKRFGKPYSNYKNNVPRIIPFLFSKRQNRH